MKKIYLLLTIFIVSGINAQVINFPDVNFKAALISSSFYEYAQNSAGDFVDIDLNGNGEIEASEALNISALNLDGLNIANMQGIEYFTNLTHLSCSSNTIVSLDLTSLSQLNTLYCNSNNLTYLNFSGLSGLANVFCNNNQLSAFALTGTNSLSHLDAAHNNFVNLDLTTVTSLSETDLSGNPLQTLNIVGLPNLEFLGCENCNLTDLNLTGLPSLSSLSIGSNLFTYLNCTDLTNMSTLLCSDNPNLTYLFLKNGNPQEQIAFGNCPQLRYICADPSDLPLLEYSFSIWPCACEVNTYCSFVPGGTFYTINGTARYDENNDGCSTSDAAIPNFKISVTNSITSGDITSNTSGDFSTPVQTGTHVITPLLENPTYFNVSPSTLSVVFPDNASPFVQNFCITANEVHRDLEIVIIPLNVARPGVDSSYKINYKNNGTHSQSGSISLAYNDAILDLVNANPAVDSQANNSLNWNFTDLLPFETRSVLVTLNTNTPLEIPPVNSGDILNFTVSVNGSFSDETADNNLFNLNQTVVNSLDPNDKTCLEGNTVTPEMIGKYMHYMIRFENTGTANAQNIVVKDMIDTTKFDISSLVPIDGSAPFTTKINGNKVEFIFENIQLPFDDSNNDGYVAFKIKTKPILVLGDTFSNTANIYFDYNFPIVTNTATTTISALAKSDFAFENYFSIYPNPADNVLSIESKKGISISSVSIYNTLGQLVLVVPNASKAIDVSILKSGNYFIKINSDKGTSNSKFIKK